MSRPPALPPLELLGLALCHANLPDTRAFSGRLDSLLDGSMEALPPQQRLPDPSPPLSRYGIPPIYRSSVHRVQWPLLALAEEALDQARGAGHRIDPERCDVILVTALGLNRSFENEARPAALRWAERAWAGEPDLAQLLEAWRHRVAHDLQASSHDKVGEMASALAARVAAHLALQGRVLALESQAEGGLEALRTASLALDQGGASQVLLLAAQTLDSPRCGEHPVPMAQWREGACALLLGRPASGAGRPGAPGDRVRLQADLPGSTTPAADGMPGPELRLAGRRLPLAELTGYGHAVAQLQALGLARLLRQRVNGVELTLHLSDSAGQPWTVTLGGAEPACDAEGGDAAARGGTPAHQGDPAATPAPIGVVSAGAAFGDTRGLAGFWNALQTPGHRFRPLDAERHACRLHQRSDPGAALSFYIDRASHAALPDGLDGGAAALALARSAVDECWQPVSGLAEEALGRLLVVCATPLTTAGERRAGAAMRLPDLLHGFDAMAEAQGWPADRRGRLRRALVQACEHESRTGQDTGPRSASALGRALAPVRTCRVVALEAACASSMAAVDLALNALRGGDADTALVVGVELPVNTSDLLLCSAQRMLAPTVMAAFGTEASGFTPGDGAGAVLLMRSERARWLGLPELARLRAAGASTDSKSMIAPNVEGQTLAMRRAFEQLGGAGVGPASLQYLETHGTGTLIGDQVETRSIAAVYGAATRGLALGALKSQFGHCFAAAGMASLIKTLLCLQHEQLPANHFERALKPELGWEALGLDCLRHGRPWKREPGRVRRAGVNAFGTGGINHHLVLEEA